MFACCFGPGFSSVAPIPHRAPQADHDAAIGAGAPLPQAVEVTTEALDDPGRRILVWGRNHEPPVPKGVAVVGVEPGGLDLGTTFF